MKQVIMKGDYIISSNIRVDRIECRDLIIGEGVKLDCETIIAHREIIGGPTSHLYADEVACETFNVDVVHIGSLSVTQKLRSKFLTVERLLSAENIYSALDITCPRIVSAQGIKAVSAIRADEVTCDWMKVPIVKVKHIMADTIEAQEINCVNLTASTGVCCWGSIIADVVTCPRILVGARAEPNTAFVRARVVDGNIVLGSRYHE